MRLRPRRNRGQRSEDTDAVQHEGVGNLGERGWDDGIDEGEGVDGTGGSGRGDGTGGSGRGDGTGGSGRGDGTGEGGRGDGTGEGGRGVSSTSRSRDTVVSRRRVLAGATGLSALALSGVAAGDLREGVTRGEIRPSLPSIDYGASLSDPALERHVAEHGLSEPPTLADVDTRRTLDAVEDVGLDPNGNEPIQGRINRELEDGVRIEFPDGTYRLSGAIEIAHNSNFALVGTGDVTFVVDSDIAGNVVVYRQCRDCAFAGIVVDQSASNCTANLWFRCYDGLVVSDVEIIGYSDPSDSKKKIVPLILDDDGVGRIERFRATDGTEVGRQGVDHNREHKQRYDGGAWVGPPHEGTIYFVDCELANWSDNGLYASRTNGGVIVAGGYYANCSISQIRVSHEHSFVGGGVEILVDREAIPERNNPSGLTQPRGIWLENGSLDNGGVTIGDVWIRFESAPSTQGAIALGRPYGHAAIYGPVHVEMNAENVPVVNARTPDGGHTSPPPSPHHVRIENLSITGAGGGSTPLVQIADRPNSYVRNSCIDHDGPNRAGIRFYGSDGEVSDTIVNVDGRALQGVSTQLYVDTSRTCEPRPGRRTDVTEREGLDTEGSEGSEAKESSEPGEASIEGSPRASGGTRRASGETRNSSGDASEEILGERIASDELSSDGGTKMGTESGSGGSTFTNPDGVVYYANDDGIVDIDGVGGALYDFLTRRISFTDFRRVVSAWITGHPVA